jgi:succinate dehydrogenase/fumarate reductase flavoprotein subunit
MSQFASNFIRNKSRRTALAVIGTIGGGTVLYHHISSHWNRLRSDSIHKASAVSHGEDGKIQVDVLIVGSGGAALTAALRAKTLGFSTLVVEKASKIGGTSNFSGGGLWIPNTHLHARPDDSAEKALTYMEAIIENAGPASSRERKISFLENGPKMVKFLEEEGYKWTLTRDYPDYFPYHSGAQIGGRTIEPGMFDLKLLGPWKDMLNMNPARAPLTLYTYELSKIVRARCSWDGMLTAAKVYGARRYLHRFLGEEPVTLGVSMISQLLYMNIQKGVSLWTDSPMKELVVRNGRVTGAIISQGGKNITVEASRGVILAAGGFARNEEMRKKYQPSPITADWTSTTRSDEGDAILAGMRIGAATALLDSAWWGAAMYDPASKHAFWCLYDRGLPHSIIVDQSGKRFTNESQNYNSIGRAIWERQKENPAVPSFLVMDSTHRSRYILAGRFMPGPSGIPQSSFDSGFITKADSLFELGKRLDVDPLALEETVKRFNGFVATGIDEDFSRGSSIYDQYLGDPDYPNNRNLGTVAKAPFYAVKLWPGDLGTKGGLLTDEKARVLTEKKPGEYDVIKGLYAVGNTSASVMGRTYAGAGATLGPALTFAYIAVNAIAEETAEKKLQSCPKNPVK